MSSPPSSPERSQSSNDNWMYSSEAIPRYGSEDELDTDDPFWEFIDEPKYIHEEEESEDESVAEEVKERKAIRKTKAVILLTTNLIMMVITRIRSLKFVFYFF